MLLALKLILSIVAAVALYLCLLAWRALYHDSTLSPGQRTAQALLVAVVPVIGALIVLRLSELASPGTIAATEIPWPFRAIVLDRPARGGTNGESFEEFKRRFWNL